MNKTAIDVKMPIIKSGYLQFRGVPQRLNPIRPSSAEIRKHKVGYHTISNMGDAVEIMD